MPEQLTIRSGSDGDAYVVALYGELDLASVDTLRRELERAEASEAARIVVDLSSLRFVDSSGMALLLRTAQRLTDGTERIGFLRPPDAVQRTLALTGIGPLLPFLD